MQPKTPKLLEDIRAAASFIVGATSQMPVEEYLKNAMVRFAVERNFEIIGEAANRLEKIDSDVASQLGPVGQIVAFRNVLIHGLPKRVNPRI